MYMCERLPGADDGRLGAAAVGVEVRVEARRAEGALLAAVGHTHTGTYC